MNKKEIKAYAQRCLAGQGNQVDLGSGLADVIVTLADLLPDPADIDVKHYLTFKTADANENTVKIVKGPTAPLLELYYSYDKKEWFRWKIYGENELKFSAVKPLYMCGMNSVISGSQTSPNVTNIFVFGNDNGVYCDGSIMSLLSYAEEITTISGTTAFYHAFNDCTALVQAPELPATTLANGCYREMFKGCTSLIQAPELPATTLAIACYHSMFEGCTSLNYVKCLATTSIEGNTSGWLSGVSATGTFVKAQGVSWPSGASGIPSGWTVEEV